MWLKFCFCSLQAILGFCRGFLQTTRAFGNFPGVRSLWTGWVCSSAAAALGPTALQHTKEKGEDDIEGDTMVNNRTGGKKAQTARLPKPPRKHSCYHGAVLCPAISAPGVEIAGGVLRGTLSILRGQAAPRRGLPACGAACACRHPSRLRGSLGPAEEGNLGLVLQI